MSYNRFCYTSTTLVQMFTIELATFTIKKPSFHTEMMTSRAKLTRYAVKMTSRDDTMITIVKYCCLKRHLDIF